MGRNGTLEYARLWAAFGIVFFHAHAPGSTIGYAALPFFLILLVVMAAPAARTHAFGPYLHNKATRLLLPWLAWSLIYGGLKLGEVLATGAPLASEFQPYMLLSGPALHLWFLPFAFGVCLFVYATVAVTRQGPDPVFCGVFALLALASLLMQEAILAPAPFNQWLYGMPAVFIGLAVLSGPRHLGIQVLCVTGFSALAVFIGATEGLFQLVLAISLFLFCTTASSPDTPLARQAGSAAMGVYLAHPLILSLLSRTTSLQERSLEMAIIGCLGALIFTAVVINRHILRQSAMAPHPIRS